MAVYSLARDVNFSHHALSSVSLVMTGWCAFIIPTLSHQTAALFPHHPKTWDSLVQGKLQTDYGRCYCLSWSWTDSEHLLKWPGADVAAATVSHQHTVICIMWWQTHPVNTTSWRLSLLPLNKTKTRTKQRTLQSLHWLELKELGTGFFLPAKNWELIMLSGEGRRRVINLVVDGVMKQITHN